MPRGEGVYGSCGMSRIASRPTEGDAFRALAADARTRLEERLGPWLAAQVAKAAPISEEVAAVAQAVAELTLRGGKRLRAALVAAGFEAGLDAAATHADRPVWAATLPAMIAVELLQTYLLIHDDWMDDDAVRRGGPAVHVLLRERFGTRSAGDAAAILAGDLASGLAQTALLESRAPADHVLAALRVYARIQVDVVSGQVAELRAPLRSGPVATSETVHALKTASYTTIGPLLIGAALAGASEGRLRALERVGLPLGVAFQLRDDLLGIYGDPAATGKPVWNDIRQGKHTALVEELSKDEAGAALLAPVFGRADASSSDVEAVVRAMETAGAKARVESRIAELSSEARCAVDALAQEASPSAVAVLRSAIDVFGDRTS